MMNGHGAEVYEDSYMAETISNMVETLVENTVDGKVSDEGLEELSNIFRDVHPMDREDVFIEFLKELEDNGIDYDITQFRDYDA